MYIYTFTFTPCFKLQDGKTSSFSGQLMHKEGWMGSEAAANKMTSGNSADPLELCPGGVYRPYKDKDAVGSIQEVLLAGFEGEAPDGLEIHVSEEDLKDTYHKNPQDMQPWVHGRLIAVGLAWFTSTTANVSNPSSRGNRVLQDLSEDVRPSSLEGFLILQKELKVRFADESFQDVGFLRTCPLT